MFRRFVLLYSRIEGDLLLIGLYEGLTMLQRQTVLVLLRRSIILIRLRRTDSLLLSQHELGTSYNEALEIFSQYASHILFVFADYLVILVDSKEKL